MKEGKYRPLLITLACLCVVAGVTGYLVLRTDDIHHLGRVACLGILIGLAGRFTAGRVWHDWEDREMRFLDSRQGTVVFVAAGLLLTSGWIGPEWPILVTGALTGLVAVRAILHLTQIGSGDDRSQNEG